MMKLNNTLGRKTVELKPISAGKVTMYTCGPTVYDYPHIGNWFAFIRWDILARALRSDYEVNWVMNITDVGHLVSDDDTGEDKLEKGAKREGKTAWEVADYYGNYFLSALDRLNFSELTTIPKATDHIQEQIDLVKTLYDKGFTYTIEDGVYFDTSKLSDYGKLTNLKLEALLAGARVEMCPGKKNPTDFALWKFSPKDQKRDMEWDSPWGKGFPGWHIECSAMSMKYLGETMDIHCGGIDHIPVHHTNEIAQSEAATGQDFANIWLHSNFVKVDGKKMSKSLGNLVTLEQIEEKGFDLAAFRLLVIESHYSREAQFTWEVLTASQNRLNNWQSAADLRHQANDDGVEFVSAKYIKDIKAALNDNLDTPKALMIIDEAFNYIQENVTINPKSKKDLDDLIEQIKNLLGIDLLKADITDEQKKIIDKRLMAREDKDWQLSDQLRDKLKEQGIEVKDSKFGQIWSRI